LERQGDPEIPEDTPKTPPTRPKQCENHENIVKSTPRGIIYAKMVIFNINMNIDAPGGS
jgi:hypothetical protein